MKYNFLCFFYLYLFSKKYELSTTNFYPCTHYPPIPNCALQILLFRLKHTVSVVTHARVVLSFLHHLGTGSCLPKQRLKPKLEGVWSREASNKFGTPIYFGNRWSYIATSHLVHNLGPWVWGVAYQKQRSGPKSAGSALRERPKVFGTPIYFCNRCS